MTPLTPAEIDALAARITLADLVGLNRAVLMRAWPEVEYALLVGHIREGVPDLYLPVICQGQTSSGPPPAVS